MKIRIKFTFTEDAPGVMTIGINATYLLFINFEDIQDCNIVVDPSCIFYTYIFTFIDI